MELKHQTRNEILSLDDDRVNVGKNADVQRDQQMQ